MSPLEYIRGLAGDAETLGTLFSGALAQPAAGLAGLASLPFGSDVATKRIRSLADLMTYRPRTQEGQARVSNLAELLAPLEHLKSAMGDVGYEAAGPVGGAAATALPDALMMALPTKVPSTTLRAIMENAGPGKVGPAANGGWIAYHGSPHKFDKFAMEKLGTGEGQQAYGNGLYFADNPDIANSYARVLSDVDQMTPSGRASRALAAANGDSRAAEQSLYRLYNASADSPAMMRSVWQAIEELRSGKTRAPNTYKVDISDASAPREKFLDWDKPVRQQDDAVLQAFRSIRDRHLPDMPLPMEGSSGRHMLRDLEDALREAGDTNAPAAAAKLLNEYGVPGIRFLDAGSRKLSPSKVPTHNTVLFDDTLVKILERNGQAVP